MITYPTDKLQKVLLSGGCEQNGTPTPDNPVDIICNNGVLKVDSQGNIYTQGTQEVVTDNLGNTANAEMLLSIGDYKDTQEVLNGIVTRNVGIIVLDGTESWRESGTNGNNNFRFYISSNRARNATGTLCTHVDRIIYTTSTSQKNRPCLRLDNSGEFIAFYTADNTTSRNEFKQWLSDQYNAGTPVIIIYPLATATTETVAGQLLIESPIIQTAGSINNMPITVTKELKNLKKRYIGNKQIDRVFVGTNKVWENE